MIFQWTEKQHETSIKGVTVPYKHWVNFQEYPDLVDDKGRMPGHQFSIIENVDDPAQGKYEFNQQAQRGGTAFGALAVNSTKYFEDLDEAKAHAQKQADKARKATYKNKQFKLKENA